MGKTYKDIKENYKSKNKDYFKDDRKDRRIARAYKHKNGDAIMCSITAEKRFNKA